MTKATGTTLKIMGVGVGLAVGAMVLTVAIKPAGEPPGLGLQGAVALTMVVSQFFIVRSIVS